MTAPLGDKVRVPIGLKISGITVVLLVLMALVTLTSTENLKQVNRELGTLSEFFIPLDQTMGEVRSRHLLQILFFERMLARGMAANVETARQAARKSISDDQGCEREKFTAAADAMRKAFPAPGEREIAMYELQRYCADKDIDDARRLVGTALGMAHVKSDVGQTQKFTRLQVELDAIPLARTELHATIVKYLTESQHSDSRSIEILREQLESNRRKVSRQIGNVSRLLHGYTQETAATAHTLERDAKMFNWALLAAAVTLGLIFATILTRNLVKPVRDLLSGARAIEKGDLNAQVQVNSSDEIALLAQSFNYMVSGLKEKETIMENWGKYMDPRIVRGLLEKQALAQMGDKRVMSIFFSDIEGFTAICEQLSPDSVVKLLNHYFSVMSGPIQSNHGIIDKYIGDAIMAYWGPPFTAESEHAVLACQAALDQLASLEKFRQALPDVIGLRKGLPSFRLRIGVNTGAVIVGTIGSEGSRSYTVIGDTVNLASRLEAVNKHFGTSVIISEETWLLARNAFEVRELDLIYVAGKTEPTRVFELLGRIGEIEPKQLQLRDDFEDGLKFYRDRDWNEARKRFAACLQCEPQDEPSRVFLARLEHLQANPPVDDWDGVWSLEK